MQEIPKNVPKAPRFDNVDDLIKWYRKAYRIPTYKKKLKRLSKTVPRNILNRVLYGLDRSVGWLNMNEHIDELAHDRYKKQYNRVPKHLLKYGVQTKDLQKHVLNQFNNILNDTEKVIKQKYKDPIIRSQLLGGTLARASGVLSLLIPSALDQENTAELPYPQNPFPAEDAQIRQQQMNQLTPRAGYYGGGIVQPTAPKTKRRKRKKISWNY